VVMDRSAPHREITLVILLTLGDGSRHRGGAVDNCKDS